MVKIGDRVETCVYVGCERFPMRQGIVTGQSVDGSLSDVDIGSLHGCAPWIQTEVTASLLKIEPQNPCSK